MARVAWSRGATAVTTLGSEVTGGYQVGLWASPATWDVDTQTLPASLGTSMAVNSLGPMLAPSSAAALGSKLGVMPGFPKGADGRLTSSLSLYGEGQVPGTTVACRLEAGFSAVAGTPDADPKVPLMPVCSVGIGSSAMFSSMEAH